MKNREFAHTTIAGVIDITSRAYYREQLSLYERALAEKEARVEAQNNSIKEAAKAYNARVAELDAEQRKVAKYALDMKRAEERARKAEESLAAMTERHSELQTAYNGAKLRLQKYDRARGANGRWAKKSKAAAE